MKKFLVAIVFSVLFFNAYSAHIKGGFITYQYLGPGINNPGYLRYKITLTIYMVCNPSVGQLTDPINLTVFAGNGTTQIANPSVNITNRYNLGKAIDEPCITGNQAECYYTIVVYELDNYELPVASDGYVIAYQRCCRIASMDNVQNSSAVGNTYSIKIPGTSSPVVDANKNSSPNFGISDTAVVCAGSFFSFPLGATDADGDVLTYSLCTAFSGGSTSEPTPNPSAPQPFGTVTYESPYSGSLPMGSQVLINSSTGLLSGVAPPIAFTGEYVVTVCVTESRNGVVFAESRKELHIRVRDCVPLRARLDPKPVTCDGFAITFSNAETLPSGTDYQWDFGDPTSAANISNVSSPAHTYTDSGIYTVKLRVSIAGLCADSTTLQVKVYPGFFPAFNIDPPYCKGSPIRFNDQTTTRYGVPTGWRWDFGDNSATNDSSNLKNPTYAYPSAGPYKIKLIVGNTFGCVDSVYRDVTIVDKPPLTVSPKDTSYCALDSIQLSAIGSGSFTWTPATNIIGANTRTPKVFPPVPTKYYVTMNDNGCINKDSVTVNPVNNFTNSITASATSICEEDSLTLTGNSNFNTNVTWSWNPVASVRTPLTKTTTAFPSSDTRFTLTSHWGLHCVAVATQDITVRSLAVPDAGPPTFICKGQNSAQLQATGGNRYQWTPVIGLSNSNVSNPLAFPATTTTYIVAVGVTGCTKTRIDSVTVTVRDLPKANLTNDTLICSIDTLQLKTNAAATFVWTPNYMISNLTVPNPLVSPDVPTTYFTTFTDQFGCINKDSVFVDVKTFVTINAGNDTTICRTDTIQVNTVSDALSFKWSPSTYLNSDTAKRPLTNSINAQITYTVIGNIGKCQSSDNIKITTVPYPVVSVGPEQHICFGDSALLHASGGSRYSWSPVIFLNNPNTADPVSVKPTSDTRYTVSVTDVLGCPKPVKASILVAVRPEVLASTGIGNDTSIVIGQTIQMNASGGDRYLWEPSTWLSNANSPGTLAAPESNITYRLTVTQLPENCVGYDTVKIKVYQLPPSFYVPTAFSPNQDGHNDVLKPFALGIRTIRYFKVYNRYGQLVFETTEKDKGWDGSFKGNPQDPATYVWMAQGETYKGDFITRKGTAVLIR
jgi:gliding motility-associated-like protein